MKIVMLSNPYGGDLVQAMYSSANDKHAAVNGSFRDGGYAK
jgi:hypothetical protein